MMVLLLRSVRFPLKWKKFRGAFKFDWVGYHIDLIRKEAGINDGRSLWVSSGVAVQWIKGRSWCATSSRHLVASPLLRKSYGL